MLAEPRHKVKYSVDPRNTNWTNDDNKFGQKLMEKMGWEKGRGLGAKEDGNVQSIAVSLKNDTKGVGWNKNTEDNWIAHQDDFNDLLSSLNDDHGTNVTGTNVNGGHKILKLEEASRAAKGRVHYQKFTKGKDLSLRSETDLDCVFGKRKSKKYKPKTEEEKNPEQEAKDAEEKGGLITVTSSDSVQDYFSKKMAALKNKRNGVLDTADDLTANKDLENSNGNEEIDNKEYNNESSEVITNKKKKKKKKKDKKENNSHDEDSNDSHTQDKKKLKVTFSLGEDDGQLDKAMDVEEEFDDNNADVTDESKTVSHKKKKDLKVRFSIDNVEELSNSIEAGEDFVSSINVTADTVDSSLKKKKKKSKKKNREKVDDEGLSVNHESTVENDTDVVAIVTEECKMKDEICEKGAIKTLDTCEPEAECDTSKRSSKESKKRKNENPDEQVVVKKMKVEEEDRQEGIIDNEVEHLSGKKKKSKKQKKKEKLASEEVSEGKAIETTDQTDTPLPKLADTKKEILNPFPNLKPEKILLEYASKTKEDVRFISSMVGPNHKPVFKMHVEIGVKKFREVKGRTKKDAMKKAAIVAVIALNDEEKLNIVGLNGSNPVREKKVKRKTIKAIKNKGLVNHHKKFEGSLEAIKGYPGFPAMAENLSKKPKKKKRF